MEFFMKILVLLSVLVLSACMTMPDIPEQKPAPVACDTDSAYEAGMNDGMERAPMNSKFLSVCAAEKQPGLRKAYKDGYLKGTETKTAEKPPRSYDDTYSKPGVNIHIGGSGGGGHHSSRSWMCEVKPFVQSYKAFGATQEEAKYKVEKLCEKDNHSMHCDDAKCVANE